MALVALFCVFAWFSYLFPRHAITGGDIFTIGLVLAILGMMGVW